MLLGRCPLENENYFQYRLLYTDPGYHRIPLSDRVPAIASIKGFINRSDHCRFNIFRCPALVHAYEQRSTGFY